jgi:RecB family exonuclease
MVKRPRGAFPSLPDGMDNLFKNYFDSWRAKNGLPPEIDGKIEGKLFDNFEKLNIWRNINFGKGGLSAVFPEYRLVLKGAIDDLIVAPDGKFVPLDFKTRGYPTKEDTHRHYQHQLDCYALLFEKNSLPPAEYGYLLFFWPEEYRNSSARFSSELIKMEVSTRRARTLLAKTRAILNNPLPEYHQDCEFCVYRESA